MKSSKIQLIAIAGILVAGISIAASEHEDRPPSIPADRWIAIGDKAGFAVKSENNDDDSTPAELYIKTSKGWKHGKIDNPPTSYR